MFGYYMHGPYTNTYPVRNAIRPGNKQYSVTSTINSTKSEYETFPHSLTWKFHGTPQNSKNLTVPFKPYLWQ